MAIGLATVAISATPARAGDDEECPPYTTVGSWSITEDKTCANEMVTLFERGTRSLGVAFMFNPGGEAGPFMLQAYNPKSGYGIFMEDTTQMELLIDGKVIDTNPLVYQAGFKVDPSRAAFAALRQGKSVAIRITFVSAVETYTFDPKDIEAAYQRLKP